MFGRTISVTHNAVKGHTTRRENKIKPSVCLGLIVVHCAYTVVSFHALSKPIINK